jgi:hypothetical protein
MGVLKTTSDILGRPNTLNARPKPLMLAAEAAAEPKFVVNVSAMEGKFYRFKTVRKVPYCMSPIQLLIQLSI